MNNLIFSPSDFVSDQIPARATRTSPTCRVMIWTLQGELTCSRVYYMNAHKQTNKQTVINLLTDLCYSANI